VIPEPKDKLDAATALVGAVSGPEDATLDWSQIDWRSVEENVRRLRQRIFTASKAGDLARVRRLQRLMLRSRSNTLLSVRRVTERNAGRLTAGVDGEVVLSPEAKMKLADRVQHSAEPFKAMPVRRVYIPKRGNSTKRRPLGIPCPPDGGRSRSKRRAPRRFRDSLPSHRTGVPGQLLALADLLQSTIEALIAPVEVHTRIGAQAVVWSACASQLLLAECSPQSTSRRVKRGAPARQR